MNKFKRKGPTFLINVSENILFKEETFERTRNISD